jgi:hypothetical protein
MYSTAGPGMSRRSSDAAANAAMVETLGMSGDAIRQTPTSTGSFGGPSRNSVARCSPTWRGRGHAIEPLVERRHQRSSKTYSALSCLPRQARLRLERCRAHQVDALALPVVACPSMNGMMCSRVQMCGPISTPPRPAPRRARGAAPVVGLAGLDAAAWQRPPGAGVGELEANQQHSIVGVEHHRSNGLADAQLPGSRRWFRFRHDRR